MPPIAWFTEGEDCDGFLECTTFNLLLVVLYVAGVAVILWAAVSVVMVLVFLVGALARREGVRDVALYWWFLPFQAAEWHPVVAWFLAVAALVLATVGGFALLAWLFD